MDHIDEDFGENKMNKLKEAKSKFRSVNDHELNHNIDSSLNQNTEFQSRDLSNKSKVVQDQNASMIAKVTDEIFTMLTQKGLAVADPDDFKI